MSDQENYARETLEQLASASLKEQKRRRRWGIFFKFIYLIVFIFFIWALSSNDSLSSRNRAKPHTSLIDIRGTIQDTAQSNADNIVTSLNLAFKDKNTRGIILRINSPGGSPVQAAYVFDEVIRLEKKYPKIPVYAVCSDVCASAAYYIAASANQIYANQSSLVGSIGVLMNGFGFVDSMNKLGIQRRLITSGDHKGFLDPFSPMSKQDEEFAAQMLKAVHQQFIDSVKLGRGNRLKNDPNLFSGLAWTGKQAIDLGLIDGFGSSGYVAREIIKNDTVVDYTVKPNYVDILANKLSASFTQEVASKLGIDNNILH